MKTPSRKPSDTTENLIESKPEKKELKGASISVYLNAESLRYLDELCKLFDEGRSETINRMIEFNKRASLSAIDLLLKSEGNDPKMQEVANKIRKMARA
jgi:hypothetical protein